MRKQAEPASDPWPGRLRAPMDVCFLWSASNPNRRKITHKLSVRSSTNTDTRPHRLWHVCRTVSLAHGTLDTHLSSCQTPTIAPPPPPRLPGDPAHPHRLPAACQCDVTQKERNKTNHESHGHRDESSGGRHGNPNRHGRSKVNICLESRRRGSLWTRGGVDVQSLAIKALFGNVSLLCCQEAQHGETKPVQRRGRYSSKGRDTLIAPCDPPLAFVYELIKHCSAAAGASSAPSPQRHLDSQWLLQSSFLLRPL